MVLDVYFCSMIQFQIYTRNILQRPLLYIVMQLTFFFSFAKKNVLKFSTRFQALVRWLIGRAVQMPQRYMLIILAVIIGLSTGFIAVLLKNLVHITNVFVLEKFDINSSNILYFVLPFIGLLLTVLFIRYYGKRRCFARNKQGVIFNSTSSRLY